MFEKVWQNKEGFKLSNKNEQQNLGGINVQQNIDKTRRLTIENDIIDYLWDNTDRNVVSGILKEKFEIEDLEVFNKSIQTFGYESRSDKTRDFLYYINTWDNPNQAMTNVLTGRSKYMNHKENLKCVYSGNTIMQNLSDVIEESIKNWENPFIKNWENSYYAVKVPSNLQQQLNWGDTYINNKVNDTGIFVIEGLNEKNISDLRKLTIISSEERLYELVKKSKNPHELIKDKVFFDQFKQYVYQYGDIPPFKSEEDEVEYVEMVYKSFLRNKLFLKVEWLDASVENEWKKREEEINKEYIRIMEEAQKKAKELNNQYVDNILPKDNSEWFKEEKKELKKRNFNTAKWVVIAEELNLWNKLWNYGVNLDSYDVNYSDLQEFAFNSEWQEFIKNNEDLNWIITKDDMIKYNIFDKEHNVLNLDGRYKFCEESDTVKKLEGEELEKKWHVLNEFFWGYENTFSELLNNPSKQKESVNNCIKNYAIGSVIDNVKGIFTEMSKNFEWNLSNKWFIFVDNEPVKIDWNNLVINWNFNWTNTIIRYDLSTGEVFMNSFIQYNITDNKFEIWENSGAYQKIGNFENFNDYLSNKYESKFQNLEDIKNISSNIKLIGEEITNASKKQSAKNAAVMKLLKTYNILWYPWWFENIEFNSGSKFFEFIKIVDSTAENQATGIQNLDFFNNKFMATVMEYAWLVWWENNLEQKKHNPKSSILFNENNDNETIKYLRDKIKDFNPDTFKWIGNFDSSQNLWIIDLILDDMLNESKTELSISKMENFIINLETGSEKP